MHSLSPSHLHLCEFSLHTPSERQIVIRPYVPCPSMQLLLFFFYLNGDHDTVAFPSGLDGYLFMTANYQHLTQLQSLDSLGRCLVLITNRWLAGAICWYQSFSFAGDDACGSVCVLINEQWWMWSYCCCYYDCTLMNWLLLSASLFRS